VTGDDLTGERRPANPHVEVSEDRVRMWFGDRQHSMFTLQDLIVCDYCLADS